MALIAVITTMSPQCEITLTVNSNANIKELTLTEVTTVIYVLQQIKTLVLREIALEFF